MELVIHLLYTSGHMRHCTYDEVHSFLTMGWLSVSSADQQWRCHNQKAMHDAPLGPLRYFALGRGRAKVSLTSPRVVDMDVALSRIVSSHREE